MNKACKGLIEKSKTYTNQKLKILYIINSNKLYNGFWGKNGYNNLIVLGEDKDGTFYNLTKDYDGTDVINIRQLFANENCSIDISGKYNCVRVWFNKPVIRQYVMSSLCLVPAESEVAKKYGSF